VTRAITDVEEIRRKFANRIAAVAQLQSSALVEALALVPREDFVGPGPWRIMRPPFTGDYIDTPDADPVHLYDTVVVALDASRHLNNGEPSGLATWLDVLDISRGMRFLHIGCGVGYYTAVVALAVSSQGAVLALEADAELAERAQRNLAPYPNVEVRRATSPKPTDGGFDAIFVNAGATGILAPWLDQLREGGRLLLPLTTEASVPGIAGAQLGSGRMLRVEKRIESYAARFISPVGIFHCLGARTVEGEEKLRATYQRGDWSAVRSLRRDRHDEVPSCWLHEPSCCLSRIEP
jgi:protein-L-isoaspartate(D-aspartate) O-methyltransferase